MNLLALLALFMLAKPSASTSAPATTATAGPTKAGARVVGKVLMIPLSDGTEAIVATLPGVGPSFDALVIARGTVYGSRKGEAVVLRCGSEADAKAIATELRGKF